VPCAWAATGTPAAWGRCTMKLRDDGHEGNRAGHLRVGRRTGGPPHRTAQHRREGCAGPRPRRRGRPRSRHLTTGQPYLMRILGFGFRSPKIRFPVPTWPAWSRRSERT
jgi:hypothetical protein